MNCFHCLQRLLNELLAEQLAECIEDDAIADAKKEMERSGNDAFRDDDEKRLLAGGTRMFVVCSAVP